MTVAWIFPGQGSQKIGMAKQLENLPNKYLFSPWEAPKEVLMEAGIELGLNYPNPIVDLKLSREIALEAFATTKKEKNE